MRYRCILSLILFYSCSGFQSREATPDLTNAAPTDAKVGTEKSTFHTTQDTIYIVAETGDTLKYEKEIFNAIVDNFPGLTDEITVGPDETYFASSYWKDIVRDDGTKYHLSFGSEAGHDEFYILYAWFLKKKNGIDKFKEHRKRLIGLYDNINSLIGRLEYGGTYYTHQRARILAYAEYSIFLYDRSRDFFNKKYDISSQRQYYIKGLRQLIQDESVYDLETTGQQKFERNDELNRIVDSIEKEIIDYFYLDQVREFQYSHY